MYRDLISSFTRLASEAPDAVVFQFLKRGEGEPVPLTRARLDAAARAIGAGLQNRGLRGCRLMVCLPPGLEYVSAMLGCFYAGAIPVPAPPPLSKAEYPRIRGILHDCEASAAIVHPERGDSLEAFGDLRLLDVDALLASDADGFEPIHVEAGDLAYLQYTSGSTGAPKGVRITHGNLADNCWQIMGLVGHQPYRGVVWLPPYHDMGLIGGVMMPMLSGFPITLMPALSFLQRPIRWLSAMSRLRATTSAAPDFAFRLCVERTTPEEREGLDLSSWTHAFCGAEPIRTRTFDLFCETFAPHGFRRSALLPSYGLAESTLLVTGKPHGQSPRAVSFSSAALDAGKAEPCARTEPASRVLVSCGRPSGDTGVLIVDPARGARLPDGSPGEIWVYGSSVSPGYWRAAEPEAAYVLYEGRRYLRTGDLGFLHEGELFICGRIKNVLVIRGKNFHCEDLEYAAASGHELLAPQGCAALSMDDGEAETLSILAEVDRKAVAGHAGAVLQGVVAAISERHGITPAEVLLIKRGNLARTTSGKLRRHACRELHREGSLNVLARWPA